MWAVVRYELTWDLRKKRTYLIVGLFLFAAFVYAYLLPIVVGKSVTTGHTQLGINSVSNLWWVMVVYFVFNTFVSGVFPLLIGGFIAADSLASEFDENTITPLLSQPIRRVELYAGKFVEKILLLLVVSVLFTLLVLAGSEASVGSQAQLYTFPLLVFAEFGAFLEFAALAFFFGSFSRSGLMVLGILIALVFGVTGTVLVLGLHFGLQESMFLVPMANADFLINVVPYYIYQPWGVMVLQGSFNGAATQPVVVTVISALEYAVSGLVMIVVSALIAGYYVFRRSEVKG
jgi:ABC-type transport system involved in multi-copper enzyme maturation permease subunit